MLAREPVALNAAAIDVDVAEMERLVAKGTAARRRDRAAGAGDLDEARRIFEALGAKHYVERVDLLIAS